MRRCLFGFAALIVSPVALAQDGFPVAADRPSFSDGTLIIPEGRWQIEGGYSFSKVGQAEVRSIGELLFRFPVGKRAELRFSNLSLARANAAAGGGEGMLDPVLGAKFRFQAGKASKTPDLALIAQATLPAGDRDFRVKKSQPTLKFAGYFQADATNGYGWNVAWSHLGNAETEFHQWAVSGYWSKAINAKTGSFVEVYHLMPSTKGGPHVTFADAGFTYLLNKATQVDFRLGSGMNQRRDGWFVGAGVAYRF